eukprot:CAMPEP_0170367700 /NCGR_PEP_ID=MMETSP0117_2-20130122/7067_1 /TAXON_ID=400756 /ORGANISM="Durinskia baltica, Strain CSIRO CS-38" /LENGTH=414 /DNA_ID=CAMNT_0010622325 /DNA_START=17 /DNA_END=1261 /DNA_ORIENTATION=+
MIATVSSLLAPVNEIIRIGLSKLNVTWELYSFMFAPDLKPEKIQEMLDHGVFPTLEGLAPAFTFAIILSFSRYFLHIFVIQPFAEVSMKIKAAPLKKIPEIDAEFKSHSKAVTTTEIKQFCAKSGRKVLDVRNYLWTRKKNLVIKKKIAKFVEASWRFIFYLSFCILGYNALFVPETAIWINNTMHHFIDWPLHPVTDIISLYYQIELGCYFHQLLWTEVTHSDALEMLAHHFITILLLIGSYLTNYTRIGASILLIHDLADVFLECAKVLNYIAKARNSASMQVFVDVLFGVFMVVFFVTRLVIYPRYILYSVIVEGVEYFGCEFGGCYFFIGLLCSLQVLHIFWFYLIARMAYRLLIVGSVEKDVRSDDEGEDMLTIDGPADSSGDEGAKTRSSTSTGTSATDSSAARRRKN